MFSILVANIVPFASLDLCLVAFVALLFVNKSLSSTLAFLLLPSTLKIAK